MKIYENFNLTNYNSYKIIATCSKAYFPENIDDIISIYKIEKRKINVIGNGNNIILSKRYYEEPFIIFSNNYNKVVINKNYLKVECGTLLKSLSEIALNNSLSGLEIFYDIPGSIGGAITMNAGAYSEEIKDLIINVEYLDISTNQIHKINKEQIYFEYRNSVFQQNKNLIILNALLELKNGEYNLIKSKMESIKIQRWQKQPRNFPNAGSTFKRPKGKYVGQMIEELGLKGYSIGGAKVSEKHAGFIINYDNATGSDIICLINIIKENIFKEYGINLEIEQKVI